MPVGRTLYLSQTTAHAGLARCELETRRVVAQTASSCPVTRT